MNTKHSPTELLKIAQDKAKQLSAQAETPEQKALLALTQQQDTSAKAIEAEVAKPITPTVDPELVKLRAQLAESQAAEKTLASKLAVANNENAELQAKMPVDNFITLRSSVPHFSVIIDNERYLFRNGVFKTLDPALAAQIVTKYQGITQEAKHV